MKSCPTCRALYPDNFTVCPQDAAPLRPATDIASGAVLRGKYEILEKLGQGGMGVVYKVRHVHFDELYALKIVTSHLSEDPTFLQRFRAEALLMRRLNHPHAVRVHDFDETEDGRPFMVMEYVEGQGLDKLLAEAAPLDTCRAIRVAMQVSEALAAAHHLGIIHRDIKPANVLVAQGPDGGDFVKVLDFGVAKVKEHSQFQGVESLTRTGFVVGTPDYMSPEQAQGVRGDQLDGRTDIYSLGVVLYEMLTGDLPFRADTPVMMLMAHIQKQPPDPRTIRAEIPGPLARVILYALEKSPALRFASAEAMHDALKEILEIEQIGMGTVRVLPSRGAPREAAPRADRPAGAGSPPSGPDLIAKSRDEGPGAAAPTQVVTPPPRRSPAFVRPEAESAEEVPASHATAPAPPPQPRTIPVPAPRAQTLPPLPSYAPAPRPSVSKAVYVGTAAVLLAAIAVGGYLVWNRTPHPSTAPPVSSQPSAGKPQATVPSAPPPVSGEERVVPAQPRKEAGAENPPAGAGLEPVASPRKEKIERAVSSPSAAPLRAANPRVQEVHRLMASANSALDAGRYDEAIANFRAVLQLEPRHAAARVGLQRARRAKAAEEVILKRP